MLLFLGFSGEAFHCTGMSVLLVLKSALHNTYQRAQHLLLLSEGHVLVLVVVAMSLDCSQIISKTSLAIGLGTVTYRKHASSAELALPSGCAWSRYSWTSSSEQTS